MFNAKTQLNMVIGYPLEHTKSPLLHNTVYQALNYNAVLLACATPNLASIMQAAKTLSVGLMAVTMPFKEEILHYVEGYSPEVGQLKAANTVIQHDGKLWAYNTDIDGIAYALREVSLLNKNVLIIGAGGAARAMAYHAQKNQANLFWLNRTVETALALIDVFGGEIIESEALYNTTIDVIINTTPLGLFPNVNSSPLPNYRFNSDQVVFDMLYNPLETLLIRQARAQGAFCISGLDMFLGQGLRQIELWSEKTIDKDAMIKLIKNKMG